MAFIILSLVGGWLIYWVTDLAAIKYLGMSVDVSNYLSILVVAIYAIIVIKTKISSSRGRARRQSVSIVCSKCDQYLGTADSFNSPCPRCGSNRYKRE